MDENHFYSESNRPPLHQLAEVVTQLAKTESVQLVPKRHGQNSQKVTTQMVNTATLRVHSNDVDL